MTTTYDYYVRACRRSPGELSGIRGEVVSHPDGNQAQFSVCVESGLVAAAEYRASSCITLIAVCEHLAQWIRGRRPAEVLALDANAVLEVQSDIPAEKSGSVKLAIDALHSAVRAATL